MILPGSYANGFAPRDGQPLYPELWRGCVGAWAPCLGPTGLTLRDWSSRKNNGALSGMTSSAWVPHTGRYALSFAGAGSGNRVVYANLVTAVPYTFSIWARATSLSGGGVTVGGVGYAPFGVPYAMYVDATNIYIAGTTFFRAFSFNSVVGAWHNYTCVVTSDATRVFVNGTLIGTQATAGNQTFQNIGAQADNTFNWNGSLDDFAVWDRALSTQEIALRARRRGIAFELAPRRRASVAVQFNRRRRLLVGAH